MRKRLVQFAAAARNCSAFCCTELSNPIQRSEENGQFPCLRIHGTQTAVSMHVSRKSLARLAADRESRSDSLSEVAPAFICAGPGVLAGSSVPPPPRCRKQDIQFFAIPRARARNRKSCLRDRFSSTSTKHEAVREQLGSEAAYGRIRNSPITAAV